MSKSIIKIRIWYLFVTFIIIILYLKLSFGQSFSGELYPEEKELIKTRVKEGSESAASYITEDLKRKITATTLAESYPGQEESIRWIYYHRIKKTGGIKGLEGSAAYSGKHIWYKIWLFILGDHTYGEDSLLQKKKTFKGYTTIKDFCKKNSYMRKIACKRAERVKNLIEHMFQDPSKNPYKGWIGQGNIDDFNNISAHKSLYWKRARAYYWLQVEGKVKNKYVEVLSAGENTQFIFDAVSIKKYIEKNKLPDKVPEYQS
ncbi:MAG: hypothetical protein ACMUJM_18515 [bacterium]